MPPEAMNLALFFTVLAVILGAIAWWLVGPRRPLAVILPVIAAFAALYLIGHKSGLEVGPTVELFGFRVALLFDAAVGALAAFIVAKAQCMVLALRAGRATAR